MAVEMIVNAFSAVLWHSGKEGLKGMIPLFLKFKFSFDKMEHEFDFFPTAVCRRF